jgi:hypothetical protein
MPETIIIDGLTVLDQSASTDYNGVLLVSAVNTNTTDEPYPYRLTRTIYLSGFASGKPYRMSNDFIRESIRVQLR